MADDVASGAVKFLGQASGVTGTIGVFPASDTNPGMANAPWIFKDDLLVMMEGQGSSTNQGLRALALVCSAAGDWNVPEPLVTPRFNRLQVDLYADTQRDTSHNMLETSGEPKRRLANLFTALNLVLHLTNPDMLLWGDLRVVGSQLLAEPTWAEVPDGDGVWTGTAYYGVMIFGGTDFVS